MLFNPATNEALAATGDGHLTVIKQDAPGHFSVEQTLATLPGARTIALDRKTGHIFLMTVGLWPGAGRRAAAACPAASSADRRCRTASRSSRSDADAR